MALASLLYGVDAIAYAKAFPDLPGHVIAHSPKSTGTWLASPSIAILADDTYLASHDEHGPNARTGTEQNVRLYRSRDKGQTWTPISNVAPLHWATLFVRGEKVYLFGPLGAKKDLGIYESNDGGETWSAPCVIARGEFHTSSMPFVEHRGRLWRAVESFDRGPDRHRDDWYNFVPRMVSIPIDANLMDPAKWTISNAARRPSVAEAGFEWRTWLEGNAVAAPDGTMKIMMRCDYRHTGDGREYAALVDVSEDGKTLTFNPSNGFIPFAGGCKKFNVRFDPESSTYFALTNFIPARHRDYNPERTRNSLVLLASTDLRRWKARAAIAYHSDTDKHGFQYSDWHFDGDDLVAAIRCAFDDGVGGANSQHDANLILFKRIPGFRALRPADSCTPWYADELKAWNETLEAGE